MAKEEKFTFLSADGKTTIHAVKWIPEDGKERGTKHDHETCTAKI